VLKIGQKIGRYRIDDILPEGGEAALARSGQFVLKVPVVEPGDPAFDATAQRFRDAASIRIGHPAVPDPVELFEHDNRPVLVLPFIPGADLEAHIQRRQGPLPADHALSIARGLADALQAVHAQLVHRDIKPSNVIIDEQGSPHLTDFSIALLPGAARSGSKGLLGTPPWLPPEQRTGADSVDGRADLYAVGGVLLYTCTGQRPPENPDDLRLPDAVPEPAATVIPRALARDPADRYQTAQEMLAALSSAFCPACGAPGAGEFCHRCGTPSREPQPGAPACLACSAALQDTSQTCPGCGRQLTPYLLRFRTGTLRGRVYLIPAGAFELGRETLGGDRAISRRHAAVCSTDAAVVLTDMGSSNGSFVDGRPASTPTGLSAGSSIRLGTAIATFTRRTPT
jgi:eukaryotic-like serine/threonine-protein kinase